MAKKWPEMAVEQSFRSNFHFETLFTVHTIETETASDSLQDVRGWKKVVKNLGAYDFKLLYK